MITSMPRPSASSAYWNSRSGVRWAETTLTSYGMPSFSSMSAVWLRVDQSDLEPMITPTSALIVVPLHRAPAGASKNNKPRGKTGVACRTNYDQCDRPKAAQYTVKRQEDSPFGDP